MRVYIAGPISGLPKEQYTATFQQAEDIIRAYGYQPINPVKFCADMPEETTDIREYYLEGFKQLMYCDAIYLLPHWATSRGACMEYEIACRFQLQVMNHIEL